MAPVDTITSVILAAMKSRMATFYQLIQIQLENTVKMERVVIHWSESHITQQGQKLHRHMSYIFRIITVNIVANC